MTHYPSLKEVQKAIGDLRAEVKNIPKPQRTSLDQTLTLIEMTLQAGIRTAIKTAFQGVQIIDTAVRIHEDAKACRDEIVSSVSAPGTKELHLSAKTVKLAREIYDYSFSPKKGSIPEEKIKLIAILLTPKLTPIDRRSLSLFLPGTDINSLFLQLKGYHWKRRELRDAKNQIYELWEEKQESRNKYWLKRAV